MTRIKTRPTHNPYNGLTAEHILMSAFVAVEGAHGFSAFLPSIFTIRHFGGQSGTEKAIRDGEILGTLFALGLGAVVAALLHSKLPLVFAAATSVAMVSVYEYALKTRDLPCDLPSTSASGRIVDVRPIAGYLEAA